MQLPTIEFFLFFLLIFAAGTFLKRYIKIYSYFLLFVSVIFYASWSINFLAILFFEIIITYFVITRIQKTDGESKQLWLAGGISFTVIVWLVFKYFNFFSAGLFDLIQYLRIPGEISIIQLIAPLGISFYCFRIVAHLVETYKKGIAINPTIIDYANYISFFPQITAGPIALPNEFYTDLKSREYVYNPNTVILLILSGIIKKYVLASFLFDFLRDPFLIPTDFSRADLIIAAFGYSALIYTDFSGYSDLATAISNLLGFRVMQNFNMPYQSVSVADFWRRWHITLGRWLKNYIYIPLGGSRKGPVVKYANLLATMSFSGIWHGVGLNFFVWGFLHGVALVIGDLVKNGYNFVTKTFPPFMKATITPIALFVTWFITLNFVVFSRIFFNTPNIVKAWEYFVGIISPYDQPDRLLFEWRFLIVIILVFLLNFIEIPLFRTLNSWLDKLSLTSKIIFISVIVYVILNLGPEHVAPFIYYKF